MPRYFIIPDAVELEGSDRGDGQPILISWRVYHFLAVWTDDKWLDNTDAADAQAGLIKLFKQANEGDEVGIDDDVFGIYQPIMKAAVPRFAQTNMLQSAAFAHRAHFVRPTMNPPRKPATDSPIMYGEPTPAKKSKKAPAKKAPTRNQRKAARRGR